MSQKTQKILIYSIFDDEFGPMPACFMPSTAKEELIMNLAVQSLTASFFGDYQKSTEGKAIIALSLTDLSMFIYYFVIPSSKARGGTRPAAISILVDKKDECLLYDNSLYLETRIKQIIPALRSQNPSVSTVELMRLYQDIKNIDRQLQKPVEKLPVQSILKIMKADNLAKLLHCIICNLPIIIVGKDLKSVMTVCNSLTPLIPHKILNIEPIHAETSVIPAFDILVIEDHLWKQKLPLLESLLKLPIFHLDLGKFENFYHEYIFAQTLLDKIKTMKTESEIETFIRISILKMVKKAEQLEELLEKAENKIDMEVLLEQLELKNKFLDTLFLLLGHKSEELKKKLDTKEKRLKRFLSSD